MLFSPILAAATLTVGVPAEAPAPGGARTRLRPDATRAAGAWTASAGAVHAAVGELRRDDLTYVSTTGTAPLQIDLASGSAFDSVEEVAVSYTLSDTEGRAVAVSLLQRDQAGAVTGAVASWTHASAPVAETRFERTLTGAQLAAVAPGARFTLQVAPAASATPQPWSDPATWGGTLPAAGDHVHIAAGQVVLLDTDPPALAALHIIGALLFDATKPVSLSAGSIHVDGLMRAGSPTAPHPQAITITINGTTLDAHGGRRGIHVGAGGVLEFYGPLPVMPWTRLNAHAAAGASAFVLASAPGWKAGDAVAVAPTDFYGVAATETLALAADTSGAAMSTTVPIAAARWGRLQHVTDAGLSLAPGTLTKPHASVPGELDERARVYNLTRRIVIQAPNDAEWQSNGLGVHIMKAGLAGRLWLEGVQVRRGGQAGQIGRYPVHWHMLSYRTPGGHTSPADGANADGSTGQVAADGTVIEPYGTDATGNGARGCVVWPSKNRAFVIHGTCGAYLQDNVAVDVVGHAYFVEDGSERRNVLSGNAALKVRNPTLARAIKLHDVNEVNGNNSSEHAAFAGSSGFWFTNPDNRLIDNYAADCEGMGVWNSFATRCFGQSAAIDIRPDNVMLLEHRGNEAHSNLCSGMATKFVVLDEAGTVGDVAYRPSLGERDEPHPHPDTRPTIVIEGARLWKNRQGGYNNRVSEVVYRGWTVADNDGGDLSGQSNVSSFGEHMLAVGYSLNNANTVAPNRFTASPRFAFASYHTDMVFRNSICANYPFVDGSGAFIRAQQGGGVINLNDLYFDPVEVGFSRAVGLKLINSHAGYHYRPPNIDAFDTPTENWTVSGAVYDPDGLWSAGAHPAHWLVYDLPFFTHGRADAKVPAGPEMGSRLLPGQFYGVTDFVSDTRPLAGQNFVEEVRADLLDDAGASVGSWIVSKGVHGQILSNFRHFAAMPARRYRLSFGDMALPMSGILMAVTNCYRETDGFVLGVPWAGAVAAKPCIGRANYGGAFAPSNVDVSNNRGRVLPQAASLAAVEASATATFWQDTAANVVWVKVNGSGLAAFPGEQPGAGTNQDLLKPFLLSIIPATEPLR